MAPEVRSLPPRAALVFALALSPCLTPSAPAQEAKPPAASQDAVESKARLLQELDRQVEERRAELARQEEKLAALTRGLEAAKQALQSERDRLVDLKKDVEADIARRQEVVNERLAQIAKVYGAMRPKEASLALEGMEDDMAVAILGRLPGRTVGKIFDLMSKERVRELTRRLEAGRRAEGGQ